jgi:hypothetical protein
MKLKIITQTHNYRNNYGYAESFTAVFATAKGREDICVLDDYSSSNMRGLLGKVFGNYEEFICFEYVHNRKKEYKGAYQAFSPRSTSELLFYNILKNNKAITAKREKELIKVHKARLVNMSLA